jgi:hypothetical protein
MRALCTLLMIHSASGASRALGAGHCRSSADVLASYCGLTLVECATQCQEATTCKGYAHVTSASSHPARPCASAPGDSHCLIYAGANQSDAITSVALGAAEPHAKLYTCYAMARDCSHPEDGTARLINGTSVWFSSVRDCSECEYQCVDGELIKACTVTECGDSFVLTGLAVIFGLLVLLCIAQSYCNTPTGEGWHEVG